MERVVYTFFLLSFFNQNQGENLSDVEDGTTMKVYLKM